MFQWHPREPWLTCCIVNEETDDGDQGQDVVDSRNREQSTVPKKRTLITNDMLQGTDKKNESENYNVYRKLGLFGI